MKRLKRRLSQKLGRLSSSGNSFSEIEASPKEKVNNAEFDNSEVFLPLPEVSIDEIDVLEKSGSSCQFPSNKGHSLKHNHQRLRKNAPSDLNLHKSLERCSSSPAKMVGSHPSSPFGKEATYDKMEILGEGSYATVYRGQSRRTGQIVALKEISLKEEEGCPFTAIREASLLKVLRHANVVTLHDIVHTKTSLTFVFEYMTTDLGMYMDWYGLPGEGINQSNCLLFTFQLLRGLGFCHKRKILHRDIKPQNLLVNEHGELKLADFGLARAKSFPINTYSNQVVTLWYRPPDVLLGSRDYTTSLDMWGVGCIFLEMMKGSPIFPGQSDATDQLFSIFEVMGSPDERNWPEIAYLPDYQEISFHNNRNEECIRSHVTNMDDVTHEFACMLLQFNPAKRLSAHQAMRHSIFNHFPKQILQLPSRASVLSVRGVEFIKEEERSEEGETSTSIKYSPCSSEASEVFTDDEIIRMHRIPAS